MQRDATHCSKAWRRFRGSSRCLQQRDCISRRSRGRGSMRMRSKRVRASRGSVFGRFAASMRASRGAAGLALGSGRFRRRRLRWRCRFCGGSCRNRTPSGSPRSPGGWEPWTGGIPRSWCSSRSSVDRTLRRMKNLFLACMALCVCLSTSAFAAKATEAIPMTTRKVVLQKDGERYRWQLIEAPIAPLGENQVLVHVRAVSLNRGDVDMPSGGSGRDLTGFVAGTDAAGDIVQVGKRVTRAHKGMRVTSTYFRDWVDGPANAEILSGGHGQSIDGVLGEYIALDETSVMPMLPWMSYEEAVTLPTAGLTAWNALVFERKPHSGDVV